MLNSRKDRSIELYGREREQKTIFPLTKRIVEVLIAEHRGEDLFRVFARLGLN